MLSPSDILLSLSYEGITDTGGPAYAAGGDPAATLCDFDNTFNAGDFYQGGFQVNFQGPMPYKGALYMYAIAGDNSPNSFQSVVYRSNDSGATWAIAGGYSPNFSLQPIFWQSTAKITTYDG